MRKIDNSVIWKLRIKKKHWIIELDNLQFYIVLIRGKKEIRTHFFFLFMVVANCNASCLSTGNYVVANGSSSYFTIRIQGWFCHNMEAFMQKALRLPHYIKKPSICHEMNSVIVEIISTGTQTITYA